MPPNQDTENENLLENINPSALNDVYTALQDPGFSSRMMQHMHWTMTAVLYTVLLDFSLFHFFLFA